MINKISYLILITIYTALFTLSNIETVFCKNKNKTTESTVITSPKKKKTFDDSLKQFKKYDGLLKMYYDSATGNTFMAIKNDQLNKEFIYFSYSENGLPSVGHFRGAYRSNKVFKFEKYANRIEVVEQSTSFYYDPINNLSKAADANISKSILASCKIIDTDKEKGEYLINAEELFVSENLHRIKPQNPKGAPADSYYSLGNLSKSKSKYSKIRTYPQNLDVVIKYVFETPYPTANAGSGSMDDRNVSIEVQHSILEMPKNNFKPRKDDPRVGYFMHSQEDMTSASATPYKDYIHRWNLEKKDSNSIISEPKIPITWWIENTTPAEFKPIIKAAALKWNLAFEKAGFKNALQIDYQPDTATWDAGDIRYNVIRWTASPSPLFGGYGPSFVNPRTGEILGADIMLEYVFMTNRSRFENVFDQHSGHENCLAANFMQHNNALGNLFKSNLEVDSSTLLKESLYYLTLHELGHTLGLMHNMKASNLHSPAEINQKTKTEKIGLTGSVMDYPAINIAKDSSKQGQYYTTTPGPYDLWAIEYGYTTDTILDKILARSTEKQLMFGNDADDMRSPGGGIDPRIMIGDLTNDAITYMSDRSDIIIKKTNQIANKYTKGNQSHQSLNYAFKSLMAEYTVCAGVISRYVGGIMVDRSFCEQKTTLKPFTPVSLSEQKRAMSILNKYYFSVNAYQFGSNCYNKLQDQRRGFKFFSASEDPKIHTIVLNSQKTILDHLLHPNVVKRMTDASLYGNQYLLPIFAKDLTNILINEDIAGKSNGFRTNIQVEYVNRLIAMTKPENLAYDYISKAVFWNQLTEIKTKMITKLANPDLIAKSQAKYIIFLIEKSMEKK